MSGVSSLQQPDDLAKHDLQGFSESILTRGFKVIDAIDGVGLLTFGFVWPSTQIWFDVNVSPATITAWANEPNSGIWGESI